MTIIKGDKLDKNTKQDINDSYFFFLSFFLCFFFSFFFLFTFFFSFFFTVSFFLDRQQSWPTQNFSFFGPITFQPEFLSSFLSSLFTSQSNQQYPIMAQGKDGLRQETQLYSNKMTIGRILTGLILKGFDVSVEFMGRTSSTTMVGCLETEFGVVAWLHQQ